MFFNDCFYFKIPAALLLVFHTLITKKFHTEICIRAILIRTYVLTILHQHIRFRDSILFTEIP